MFVNIYHILCENSVSSVPLCEYKILEGGCVSQSESPSDVHTHRECTAWRDYILTQRHREHSVFTEAPGYIIWSLEELGT